MNLTEDQRKTLTEFLGECWHSFRSSMYYSFPDRCLDCGKLITSLDRRSFLTYQDLGDVKDALVKKGLWDSFYWKEWCYYADEVPNSGGEAEFTAWLFCPADENDNPHFCRLCSEFLLTNLPTGDTL